MGVQLKRKKNIQGDELCENNMRTHEEPKGWRDGTGVRRDE